MQILKVCRTQRCLKLVLKDDVEDRRNSSFLKRDNLPEEAKELTQDVNPKTVSLALA